MIIQTTQDFEYDEVFSLSTVTVFCEEPSCDAFCVSYDSNTETPQSVTCPSCKLEINLYRCMKDDCANLQSGDHAIMVRMGTCKGNGRFIDTDFSSFDGPRYACSTKCLIDVMSLDPNHFIPEVEYRSIHERRGYTYPPR